MRFGGFSRAIAPAAAATSPRTQPAFVPRSRGALGRARSSAPSQRHPARDGGRRLNTCAGQVRQRCVSAGRRGPAPLPACRRNAPHPAASVCSKFHTVHARRPCCARTGNALISAPASSWLKAPLPRSLYRPQSSLASMARSALRQKVFRFRPLYPAAKSKRRVPA